MSGVEGHHVSRSMSHAPSPTGAERMDVAATVQGLRSGMSSHDGVQGDMDRPSPSRLDTGTGSMRPEGGGLRVVEESPVSRSGAEGAIAKIQRALEKSPDGGETVDLSRRGFEGIGDEEIEYLKTAVTKGGVWRPVPLSSLLVDLTFRLALSYNALRDRSLAPSFSQLSRLRYLNLKGNQFSYFPEPVSLIRHRIMSRRVSGPPRPRSRLAGSQLTPSAHRHALAGDLGSFQEPNHIFPRRTWALDQAQGAILDVQ